MTTLSIEGKIQKGAEHKDKGNQYFKNSEHQKALGEYYNAILYLTGLDNSKISMGVPQANPLSEETKQEISKLLIATHSNMAACYLKLGKNDKAIASCEKTLALDDKNAKAMFRKGQACAALNETGKAIKIIKDAARLAPQDPGIRATLKQLEDQEKQAAAKANDELKKNLQKMAK
ncbi:Tetratricopeptide repeat protein 9A [Boothiomyces macroporosus]|uniref:peptidylprolyl isomerase n=1 Tax=Boothiomyces macroporosus TaxID=261099 RepID=A0AAD5Y786_9FUNG|nr:Tetratricopeptide repeat protein 9A [Boothiomyces macroporosus]